MRTKPFPKTSIPDPLRGCGCEAGKVGSRASTFTPLGVKDTRLPSFRSQWGRGNLPPCGLKGPRGSPSDQILSSKLSADKSYPQSRTKCSIKSSRHGMFRVIGGVTETMSGRSFQHSKPPRPAGINRELIRRTQFNGKFVCEVLLSRSQIELVKQEEFPSVALF
jgi:hypothetical protein